MIYVVISIIFAWLVVLTGILFKTKAHYNNLISKTRKNNIDEILDELLNRDKQTKQDTILYFILDFLYIHPFGDANGRVACILTDIILVKYGLSPIYFYLIKEKNAYGKHYDAQ